MLPFKGTAFLSFAVAILFNGCGMRPGMQGEPKTDVSEVGSVSVVATETPTGQGDTTSFSNSAEPEGEKIDAYVVRPGDNLWKIARKNSVYGSGWLYPLLVKSNKSKIKDPKDLRIGERLVIPHGLPKAEYEIAREETMAGTYDSAAGYDSTTTSVQSISGALSATAKPRPLIGAKKAAAPPAKAKGKPWKSVLFILVLLAGGCAAALKFSRRTDEPEPEAK